VTLSLIILLLLLLCLLPWLQELGASGLSKRPTSCMLILPKPVKGGKDDDEQKEFDEAYSEVEKKIKGAEA
jgi:H/ACA ribonucleoprotein complex subunit 2